MTFKFRGSLFVVLRHCPGQSTLLCTCDFISTSVSDLSKCPPWRRHPVCNGFDWQWSDLCGYACLTLLLLLLVVLYLFIGAGKGLFFFFVLLLFLLRPVYVFREV